MADQRTYKMLLGDIALGGGGGGGGILVATLDTSTGTLDKTWKEIYDAMDSSVLCVVYRQEEDDVEGLASIDFNLIRNILLQEGSYSLSLDDGLRLIASTANDYPVVND